MIQLAEDIDGYDARKVPIDGAWKRLLIEVAANRNIDIAVVDSETARKFDESDSGDDVPIEWTIEATRQHDFEWERPTGRTTKYFLLFWNAYQDEAAIVAYKFTSFQAIA